MHAIQVSQHGGPEVLESVVMADPHAASGHVVARTTVVGVNYVDTYARQGVYASVPPFVPGVEGAGEVVELGAGVSGISVGDHIVWKAVPGSYAELVAVPLEEAVPVPAGLSDETAAALILQGLTAHYLCHSTFPTRPQDWVLVHAGAGGVGRLLTQLLKRRHAHVISTVSTAEKAELARSAGADVVVDYDGFTAAALKATGGRGVDVVFDGVGQATFDGSLAALRPRGMLVLYGSSSGQVPPFELQRLNAGGSLYVTRPTLAHYVATPAELSDRCADVFGAALSGDLEVRVGGRYPLTQARRAHEDLQARRSTGKLLLVP